MSTFSTSTFVINDLFDDTLCVLIYDGYENTRPYMLKNVGSKEVFEEIKKIPDSLRYDIVKIN